MPSQTVVVQVQVQVQVEWIPVNPDTGDGGDVTFDVENGFPLTGSQQEEAFRIAQAAEDVRRLKIEANAAHARAKADFFAPWGPKPFA